VQTASAALVDHQGAANIEAAMRRQHENIREVDQREPVAIHSGEGVVEFEPDSSPGTPTPLPLLDIMFIIGVGTMGPRK
jgi:hypothetical protein